MSQGCVPSSRDLLSSVGGLDQRFREGAFVIWRHKPACWASRVEVDDEREPAAVGGDHREADCHGLEGRLWARVVDRRHHQRVAGGEGLGKLVVAPPPGEEHPVRTDLPRNRDRMFALPLARMPSPHDERYRTVEAWASAGERPHQQWDPLGGGEAPDEDQDDGVAVGAQEAVELRLAVDNRAGNCGLVPAFPILDEPPPEAGSAVLPGHWPWTEPDQVHTVRDMRYPLCIGPQHLDCRCAVSW